MQPILSKGSASFRQYKIKKADFLFLLLKRSLSYPKVVQVLDNTK